jgi:4-amino-4-deoxy-L-arabinose transferase-like glycosyltransferase
MEATVSLPSRCPNAYRLKALGVLVFAGILFFARLGERALWSEEVRWLQIPREMHANGDWFWPTINGHTYYDKPLGSYWLVLISSFVTGSLDEHSARLPSALSALVAVALTMAIARRLSNDAASLVAGLILATSFSFVFFARSASTDVETVAGVLAALWIFLKHDDHPSAWWIILLWLTMALTSLTKGLLGFALPVLVITAYSWTSRDSNGALPDGRGLLTRIVNATRWLLQPTSIIAIPLAALVYLGPFVISSATHDSGDGFAMVYRENIRRFFAPVNHRGPIYLYGYVIFMLAAPWSLLLPAGLVHVHFGIDQQGRGRRFALAFFWSVFVFFTLSASRRSYYLLPILPAVALLVAPLLTAREPLRPVALWLQRAALVVLTACVGASIVALFPVATLLPEPWRHLPDLPCRGGFVIAWLVAMAGLGYAWLRGRCIYGFGAAAGAFLLYGYVGAMPDLEAYRTQSPFAAAVQRETWAAPQRLGLYGTREIVAHLDPSAPIAEYHTPAELAYAIRAESVRWVVLRRRDWERLNQPGTIVIAEMVHAWDDQTRADEKLLLIMLPAR